MRGVKRKQRVKQGWQALLWYLTLVLHPRSWQPRAQPLPVAQNPNPRIPLLPPARVPTPHPAHQMLYRKRDMITFLGQEM